MINRFSVISEDSLNPCEPCQIQRYSDWEGCIDIFITKDKLLEKSLRLANSNIIHEMDYNVVILFKRSDDLCLDVGANVGQSIVSFHNINPILRTISFEPNPFIFVALEQVSAKYIKSKVMNIGLGNKTQTLDLYIPIIGQRLLLTPLASVNISIFNGDQGDYISDLAGNLDINLVKKEISIVPGDSLNLKPSLIKIDVEGAELGVLKGFMRTLVKEKPMLIIEKSPDFQAVLNILLAIDYEPYQFVSDQMKFNKLMPLISSTPSVVNNMPLLNIFWIHHEMIFYIRQRGFDI